MAPLRRSLLFLPAIRPERFEKALASGADVVCLDLEDAVPPADKERGLGCVLDLLRGRERGGAEIAVRVNEVGSERGRADLQALADPGLGFDLVLIPKVAEAREVRRAEAMLAEQGRPARLIPMVETAAGLARVENIAAACGAIAGLMLGGVDLTADLGAALEWDALLYARSRVVHAAALAGVDAIDTPSLEVSAVELVRDEARAVSRLGFTGKAAIHPAQVPAIHDGFLPPPDRIERARRIVSAFAESGGGALLVDGRLVDPPVVRSALRTVAIAERAGA